VRSVTPRIAVPRIEIGRLSKGAGHKRRAEGVRDLAPHPVTLVSGILTGKRITQSALFVK